MSLLPTNAPQEKKRATLPKLVVKKRKKVKTSFRNVGGLPNIENSITSSCAEVDERFKQNTEFDNIPLPFEENDHNDDIPSDTLLLLRNLQQPTSDDCWILPLSKKQTVGIPAVLESILVSRLDPTIVQTEWHNSLCQKFRRLTPVPSNDVNTNFSLAVWIETRHYILGVWDAVEVATSIVEPKRADDISNIENSHRDKVIFVVTWFVSQLQHWTARRISQEDLQKAWKVSSILSLDQAMDILTQLQVLLPIQSTLSCQLFILWLPSWGAALADLEKAQKSILSCLCRSMYQERPIITFQSKNYGGGGLTGKLVLHILESEGKVQLIQRPGGIFVRRVSKGKEK
jgi:hypothetical protein